MTRLSGSALKRAQLVPSAVFASPDAVVKTDTLSRAQKIRILRRWEFDLRGSRSLAPRVDGLGDEAGMLDQLLIALAALGAEAPKMCATSSAGGRPAS